MTAFLPLAHISVAKAYEAFQVGQKVDTYMLGFSIAEFAAMSVSTPDIDAFLSTLLVEVVLPMMQVDYTQRISLTEAEALLSTWITNVTHPAETQGNTKQCLL